MSRSISIIIGSIAGAVIALSAVYAMRGPLVRNALIDNPEILQDAAKALEAKQADDQHKKREASLAKAGGAYTKPFPGAIAGNPDGAVTLVKFTDYACGYCKASVPEIDKLIAANADLKVIYREMPILSESSRVAAFWALAAAQQGKHTAFHKAMFAAGRPDENTIMAAATAARLDIKAAAAFAASKEVATEADSNLALAQQLGISGTPAYIIGNKVLDGLQEADTMQKAIDEARKTLKS